MRLLIAIGQFRFLTGSEMHVYELSRELTRRGHHVTVVSNIGGEITERARNNGVEVYGFQDLPHGLSFDVMHLNQYEPARYALERFPDTPAVATVHSEYPVEQPLMDGRIRKYICVRPSVQEKVVRDYGIPLEKTEVIHNGIDCERFHARDLPPRRERKLVVFPGTVDPLRRASRVHLIERSRHEGFDVWFIGDHHDSHMESDPPPTVKYMPSTWNIEDYLRQADETAGILLGRTTIEGWACGKPGWIYDVDLAGNIRSVALHSPPPDMGKYDIRNVTDRVLELYTGCV